MLTPSTEALLTRAQIAQWLKVHPKQVARMGVPALHLSPRVVRYQVSVVAEWLASQGARQGRQWVVL